MNVTVKINKNISFLYFLYTHFNLIIIKNKHQIFTLKKIINRQVLQGRPPGHRYKCDAHSDIQIIIRHPSSF